MVGSGGFVRSGPLKYDFDVTVRPVAKDFVGTYRSNETGGPGKLLCFNEGPRFNPSISARCPRSSSVNARLRKINVPGLDRVPGN